MSQEGHQQRYRYNSIGQLTSIAQTLAGESTALTASFSDYQFGRPRLITYPSAGANGGLAVRRDYDSHGVLLAVRRDGQADALWSLTDVDAYDQSSKEQSADGVVSTIGHDTLGRIESIVDAKLASTLHQLGLVYDRNGNVATRSDGTQNEVLQYDELDRLRRASTFSGTTESIKNMQLDALGNIQQRAGVGDYTYATGNVADPGGLFLNPSKPYAVSRAGTTDFKYDRSGNMVLRTEQSGDATHYGWTPFGKIAQVWRNANAPAQGQDLLELSYDADGNRIVKRTGAVRTTYLAGLYERRARSTGSTDHVYSIDNGQRAIAQLTLTVDGSSSSSDLVFLHGDHLGSAELLTHADGTRTPQLRAIRRAAQREQLVTARGATQ